MTKNNLVKICCSILLAIALLISMTSVIVDKKTQDKQNEIVRLKNKIESIQGELTDSKMNFEKLEDNLKVVIEERDTLKVNLEKSDIRYEQLNKKIDQIIKALGQ